MTQTFDNKRVVRPIGLIDVDSAFFMWLDQKLNIHLYNDRGDLNKVPVKFLSSERWNLSREEGIRDGNGTLSLPIIIVARTAEGGPNEPGFQRIFADTKQDHTYYKQIDPKSSLIKTLNKNRTKNVDPDSPIYEIYTHSAPDHYVVSYTIDIWTPTVQDMNSVIEKIGQQLDYKSVKSFQFKTQDGYMFQAFQEDGFDDDSNFSDFTGQERIIRKSLKFKVPAYIMPNVEQKRSSFKRYFSQTKLVVKQFYALNDKEYNDFISGEAASENIRPRVPSPVYSPYNAIPPNISGENIVGSLLTCSTGTWGYTGNISYSYQWKRNNVNIIGATNNTYTTTSTDGDRQISCLVTATNEIGSSSVLSNALNIVVTVYDFITTEDGDFLLTEDGDFLIL